MRSLKEVLDFWFGEREGNPATAEPRDKWFDADPKYDRMLRDRFLETREAALAGKLDGR